MKPLHAGRLRESVAIKSYTEAADGYGQMVKTYSTGEIVRAEVMQLEGNEETQGGQYQGRGTFRFIMRYTPLSQTDRLVWDGNDYEIIEIIESINQMHRTRVLTVKAARL